jgi:hypothetical protein
VLKIIHPVALNGALILIPCALFLAYKARAGEFDGAFASVQGLKLIAGATNIVLLGLNLRDGLKMKGWLSRRPEPRSRDLWSARVRSASAPAFRRGAETAVRGPSNPLPTPGRVLGVAGSRPLASKRAGQRPATWPR